MALGLLCLTLRDGYRAWKGHDWSALDRVHKKGMIANALEKAKSVALTEEGLQRSRELFTKHFAKSASQRHRLTRPQLSHRRAVSV